MTLMQDSRELPAPVT